MLAVAVLTVATGCNHQRFPLTKHTQQPPRNFLAVDAGQGDIQQDSVGFEAARHFEWGVTVARDRDLETANGQQL
jgi:hypothetical protein